MWLWDNHFGKRKACYDSAPKSQSTSGIIVNYDSTIFKTATESKNMQMANNYKKKWFHISCLLYSVSGKQSKVYRKSRLKWATWPHQFGSRQHKVLYSFFFFLNFHLLAILKTVQLNIKKIHRKILIIITIEFSLHLNSHSIRRGDTWPWQQDWFLNVFFCYEFVVSEIGTIYI